MKRKKRATPVETRMRRRTEGRPVGVGGEKGDRKGGQEVGEKEEES